MSENTLQNIIQKKIEKVDKLKKTLDLKVLDELIDKNNTYINFKEKIDIVILDPSRKGVHTNALNWVLKLSPPQIIYVSCNIETLKKDLIELKDNYEINRITPLDMFPQTKHVECVVNLKRVSK